MALAGVLLYNAVSKSNDRDVFAERGVQTTATVLSIDRHGHIMVEFVVGREMIRTMVYDPPYEPALHVGGPVEIFYDPLDHLRVGPAGDSVAVISRWALYLGGALLLGMVIYGMAVGLAR